MSQQNVFVYGTLMYPQVLESIINRVPRHSKAVVQGYRRYAIQGQVFPGVIPSSQDSSVQGLVLFELTPSEMDIFDEFEGDEYVKVSVAPQLVTINDPAVDNNTMTIEDASMYVWTDSLKHLLRGDWNPDSFAEIHLERYVAMCTRFAEEYHDVRVTRPESRPLGFPDY